MLLLLIYEILVDLALPIAADAASRASVATLAAATVTPAAITAAANGLVASKSRRGYFAAVLSSSSSLTLFHSYSLATIRLLYCTWPSSLFVRGSRSVKLTCFSAASARLLQARRGRRRPAGYMNDVCSSLCIIHTMPNALRLTHSLENRTWKDPEESHSMYIIIEFCFVSTIG